MAGLSDEELAALEEAASARDASGDIETHVASIKERMREIINRNPPVNDPSSDELHQRIEDLKQDASKARDEWVDELRERRSEKWDEKVPPVWRGWSIDDLPDPLKAEAIEWLARGISTGQNMVLLGPSGRGKTTVAYAIAREAYLEGRKVKVWSTPALFDDIRPSENSRIVMESAKNADLLVLDDLGSERHTDWIEERLFLIVDHRWQWKLPTIVTSNLREEVLREKVSSRIMSRVFDGSVVRILKGDNFREN